MLQRASDSIISCTFSLWNQKVAILAGQLITKGWPAATTKVPTSNHQKDPLMKSVSPRPRLISPLPKISCIKRMHTPMRSPFRSTR